MSIDRDPVPHLAIDPVSIGHDSYDPATTVSRPTIGYPPPRIKAEVVEQPIDADHARPFGVDNVLVEAVGRLTEALERVERARGRLFDFHQLIGGADGMLDDVVRLLREAGHESLADQIDEELIGRNVLPGRWTYQVIEEFDDGYYAAFRHWEEHVRRVILAGRQHVYEAELKQRRRSPGRIGHEATPADVDFFDGFPD